MVVSVALLLVVSALKDHYTRYVITTDRVLRIEGVLYRQQNSIPYSKVTDLTFRQSAPDRLMNIAKIRIDSAEPSIAISGAHRSDQPSAVHEDAVDDGEHSTDTQSGGRTSTDRPRAKKVVILRELLSEIREANLAVVADDETILEAVFDDWMEGDGAGADAQARYEAAMLVESAIRN